MSLPAPTRAGSAASPSCWPASRAGSSSSCGARCTLASPFIPATPGAVGLVAAYHRRLHGRSCVRSMDGLVGPGPSARMQRVGRRVDERAAPVALEVGIGQVVLHRRGGRQREIRLGADTLVEVEARTIRSSSFGAGTTDCASAAATGQRVARSSRSWNVASRCRVRQCRTSWGSPDSTSAVGDGRSDARGRRDDVLTSRRAARVSRLTPHGLGSCNARRTPVTAS